MSWGLKRFFSGVITWTITQSVDSDNYIVPPAAICLHRTAVLSCSPHCSLGHNGHIIRILYLSTPPGWSRINWAKKKTFLVLLSSQYWELILPHEQSVNINTCAPIIVFFCSVHEIFVIPYPVLVSSIYYYGRKIPIKNQLWRVFMVTRQNINPFLVIVWENDLVVCICDNCSNIGSSLAVPVASVLVFFDVARDKAWCVLKLQGHYNSIWLDIEFPVWVIFGSKTDLAAVQLIPRSTYITVTGYTKCSVEKEKRNILKEPDSSSARYQPILISCFSGFC